MDSWERKKDESKEDDWQGYDWGGGVAAASGGFGKGSPRR